MSGRSTTGRWSRRGCATRRGGTRSGTLLQYLLNAGTVLEPRWLAGDDALRWLREAGAADVRWFVPLASAR